MITLTAAHNANAGLQQFPVCALNPGQNLPISAPISTFSQHGPVIQLETVCLLLLSIVTLSNCFSSDHIYTTQLS